MKKYEKQNLKRRYGIAWKPFANALATQGQECECCGQKPTRPNRLVVDTFRVNPGYIPKLVCKYCLHVIRYRPMVGRYLGFKESV